MAAYGPPGPINDWIFNKPGATIDTPANLQAAQHLAQWIKAGYFKADANAMDYATDDEPLHPRQRAVHVRRRLGVRELRQVDAGEGRLLPDAARAGRRQARRDVRTADLRHRRQGQARRLRRVLPQLGRDQPEWRGRSTCRSADPTRWVPPSLPMPAIKPGTVTAQTLAAGTVIARRTARWTSSRTRRVPSTPPPGRLSCRSCSPVRKPRADCFPTVQADYQQELAG